MFHLTKKKPSFLSIIIRMTSESSPIGNKPDRIEVLLPPTSVRGMKILDRSKFNKPICVPFLEVDKRKTRTVTSILRKYLLKRNITCKPLSPENKTVTLNPALISSFNSIDENSRINLEKIDVTEKDLSFADVTLTYSFWHADELLKAILPEDKESVAGYSLFGHIVHVNLREHVLEYKKIIGEILLDKVANAKTVVNKVDIIDNAYRNFKLELLSGIDDMKTQVKCNHCTFEFDFSRVYWNVRLATEHERVIKMLNEGDVLYDVFAGVGPFSIPAGKKKCIVLANDLNPDAYKWLLHNIKLNKVQAYVQAYNKDGAAFIKEDIKDHLLSVWKDKSESAVHITMNLPELGVTFLEHFVGLFKLNELELYKVKKWPVVHVYCFVKGENPNELAKSVIEKSFGFPITSALKDIFFVRNVAPMKSMMRVTIILTEDMLSGTVRNIPFGSKDDSDSEPEEKRLRTFTDIKC